MNLWDGIIIKMNNMTEKEILHVISAYKDGYRIQSRKIEESNWKDDLEPTWNFEQYEYRVKLVPEDSTKAFWQMAEYPMQIPALVECHKKIDGYLGGVPVNGFSQMWYEIRDKVEPGEYYISLYSIENLPKRYHEPVKCNTENKKEKNKGKFSFFNPWNLL